MDLRQRFERAQKEKLTAWVSFKELFKIELIYTDRPELARMLERCKIWKWKAHQRIESQDDEKYWSELASKINSWEGLTLGILSEIAHIDIGNDDPATPVPYTKDNAIALMENVYGLPNFVQDTIIELDIFQDIINREEAENLSHSHGKETGSSGIRARSAKGQSKTD